MGVFREVWREKNSGRMTEKKVRKRENWVEKVKKKNRGRRREEWRKQIAEKEVEVESKREVF